MSPRKEWRPSEKCSKAKAQRHTLRKTTKSQATKEGKRVFKDLAGLVSEPSLGGKHYAVTFVDDYTRMKEVRFLHKRSDTMEASRSLIVDVATAAGVEIGAIRTSEAMSKGDFKN